MLCLTKYEKYIDFVGLAQNTGMHWTSELLEKYRSKLNINWFVNNPSVEWSIEVLDRYKYYLDWNELSKLNIKWSNDHLKYFVNFWNWDILFNVGLSDISILKTITEHKNTTIHLLAQRFHEVPYSPTYPPSKLNLYGQFLENIQIYKTQYPPEKFVELCYKLVDENRNIIEWYDFSLNTNFPWSINFIKQYKYLFHWIFLSNNASLPWEPKLIGEFKANLLHNEGDFEKFWIFWEFSVPSQEVSIFLLILVKVF